MSETGADIILAMDTATRTLNLGLKFGGDRIVKIGESVEKTHGQILMNKIDHLFQTAGLKITDLEALVVSLGPGSFTGLRIGLAAAKGLAVAQNLSMVGVTLFQVAALRLRNEPGESLILLPSRRDEYYAAHVNAGEVDTASIRLATTTQLSEIALDSTVWGVGFDSQSPVPEQLSRFRELDYDAADILQAGEVRLEQGDSDDPSGLEPVYLQKSIAEIRFDQKNNDN